MFSSAYIKSLKKGFHPSYTRKMDGQNRKVRRQSLQASGYKDGALVVIGTTKFRYVVQRIGAKKIYSLIETKKQKFV